jgi:GNAT superfamily N-acetyltransferase
MLIRRAEGRDEDTLVAFNAAMAWETEHLRLDAAVLRRGVRAALADPAKGFYLVAEADGEVVGQTLVTFEWSDWRDGYFWWVQSVYVRPDARRGGVFRALFEHVREAAVAAPDVIGVRLYVDRDNARAQATYAALGMTEEGYVLFGLYPLPGKPDALGE